MSRLYVVASVFVALAIVAFSLAWRVPSGESILDRVAPPALRDRSLQIASARAGDDGVITIAGSAPTIATVSSMRWYVDGVRVEPARLRLEGARFEVELRSPLRDRYAVFGYALSGYHAAAMPDALVLIPPHPTNVVSYAELSAQRADPQIVAQAAIDQAWDGGQVMAVASNAPIAVHEAGRLTLVGWAVDARRGIAAPRVEAVVDGSIAAVTRPDRDRTDVVAAFHRPGYARSGFAVVLPSTVWTRGTHDIELRVLEGSRYGVAAHLSVAVNAM